jgi:SAM-dependent methyltransferase
MNRVHRWLCRSSAWKRALERRIVPWALDAVELGDELLEIGPGPGLTTDLLRRRCARLTALELDDALASALARRLAGSGVRVVRGDATAMPFPDASFSAVVSMTMLHHVSSPDLQDRLLVQAHRVLRPGGTLAGTDNTGGLGFRLLHIRDTMVLVDPGTFGERLEKAGFRDAVVDVAKGRFRFRATRPGP